MYGVHYEVESGGLRITIITSLCEKKEKKAQKEVMIRKQTLKLLYDETCFFRFRLSGTVEHTQQFTSPTHNWCSISFPLLKVLIHVDCLGD